MKGGILIAFILFFIATGFVLGQTTDDPAVKKYSYSFTGTASQQQLDKLETGMYQIKGIIQVKISCKTRGQSGIIFFSHVTANKNGESDASLNAADVKRLISDSGLVPNEFKEL